MPLAGTPLRGRRLVSAAFEAYSPDRVVSLAQAMFFELATGRHGHIEPYRCQRTRDDSPPRVIASLREALARLEPTSHPALYLGSVEAELRACVAQMMEAHRERDELVENANAAYDHQVGSMLFKGPLVKRFLASFWPVVMRLGLLSMLSAASVVLVKSKAAEGVAQQIDTTAGLLSLALGVLLTLLLGYGQDQLRYFAVAKLGRQRDKAVLEADKEEAVRLHAACEALYEAVDRTWRDHAPRAAFKAEHPGTLDVLTGNRDRVLARELPRTPVDVARDTGLRLLTQVRKNLARRREAHV